MLDHSSHTPDVGQRVSKSVGCNNSLYIFATPRFKGFNLRNPHYITLKTCWKISRSKQANCSLTTGSSAQTSSRDFRETDRRTEKPKADLNIIHPVQILKYFNSPMYLYLFADVFVLFWLRLWIIKFLLLLFCFIFFYELTF